MKKTTAKNLLPIAICLLLLNSMAAGASQAPAPKGGLSKTTAAQAIEEKAHLGGEELIWSNPVKAWRFYPYSADQLRLIYRALHNRGYFISEVATTDLTRPDLVVYIQRFQSSIAAKPTGYLTRKQAVDLMSDPEGTAVKTEPKRRVGDKVPDKVAVARASWQQLGYSNDQKQQIFRALVHLGLSDSDQMITDFSYRIDLIKIVRQYQEMNGFAETGFLSDKQAKLLLGLNAPLLPQEQENLFFEASGGRQALGYVRALGQQEFGPNNSVRSLVERFQARFDLPEHGFMTFELFEQMQTIPLKVIRTPRRPQTIAFELQEFPFVRDWGLWKSHGEETCEIATHSIHEDGFVGATIPSSFSFWRVVDWDHYTVNFSTRLANWDGKKVAELRVGGHSYYVKKPWERVLLVDKDGSRLGAHRKTYSRMVKAMMKANGFEITYETVFGTQVVASFSALGLTRQLHEIMKAC